MNMPPRERLGPYEIVSLLGAGGMGEVYRGYDRRLGRAVAIKVLPSSARNDAEAVARFEREARAVAALSHPNILAIFDVGSDEGCSYAVTELLEGETLRERLRRGALPHDEAAALARQILDGLAAAHASGIVHRDIKPENLFLTKDGRLKILDFGVARFVFATPSDEDEPTAHDVHTKTGVVVGTVAYMAPEQLTGRHVDARADIFSFGCVLFEMLTGSRPFDADSGVEVASRILNDEPRIDDAPLQFRERLAQCLRKEPESRPSADQLRHAFATTSEAPAEPRRVLPRWVIPGAAALLLAIAALIAFTFLRNPGAAPSEAIASLAVLPLENLSGDKEQEFFADGMTEALIADLAQISSLRVISRTSVMQYKRARKPLPEIARELGVQGIIEGSVLRAGDRVRITAQLIHGPTDRHLWAKSYERPFADVLALQGEVASAIASEIRATVTPQESARLEQRPDVSPRAYELYLKGRFEWNRRDPESLARAQKLFEEAVAIDPTYAAAWAGLADSYAVRLWSVESSRRALDAARRAVELDPRSSEAHASLGFTLYTNERDWEPSGDALRRAIELNPNNASAHQWYGAWLFQTNRRGEALRMLDRGVQLDPLAPRIRTIAAMYRYFSGDLKGAEQALRKNTDRDPTMANQLLSDIAIDASRTDEALAFAARCCASDKSRLLQKAYVLSRSGRTEEARAIVRQLPETNSTDIPLGIRFLEVTGDRDAAFELLLETDTIFIPYILGHPVFEQLRADARYRDFLRKVRLDPYYPAVRAPAR